MKFFWGTLGWIWGKRLFIVISLISAVLFFAWLFPFSDLSDVVAAAVARGTNGQVYVQFESLDLGLVPAPAVSASNLSIETPSLPPIAAKYLKISPSWSNILSNIWTIKKASSGDAEAASKLPTRLGASIYAEGVLGGDIDFRLRPSSTSDAGVERSRIYLGLDKLNLSEVEKWAELPVKLNGSASVEGQVQFTPTFTEQPEGEAEIRVNKFSLPASTVMVPFGGAMMPVSLPNLTLQSVLLKGHISGGRMVIDEGKFGIPQDPISGRIKGQIFVRFQPVGQSVQPQFGAYNLTVEINATRAVEKEIGFAFLLFDSAKTPTATGSHYLFQASGNGFGPPPQIVRVQSF